MFRRSWRLLALGVLMVAALVIAGCGGSGGDTTTASTSESAAASTSDTPPSAPKQEGVGGKVPADKTIGFLNIQGTAPAAQRLQAAFEAGAKKWGWTVNTTDAQGDPSKMASGIQNFVNQNVDAIVTIGVPPAAAQQALAAAKQKKIVAIVIGGIVQDPDRLYAAQYAPNDYALAATLFDYIVDDLPDGGDIVTIDQANAAVPALVDRDKMVEPILKGTGVKVVGKAQADFTNPVKSAVQAAQDLLNAHPEAKGIVTFQDYQFAPVSQALKNSDRFKDVKVYGFYAGADTLGALRDDGPGRAVADSPVAGSSWVTVDALVRYFTNDKTPATVDQWLRPYPVTLVSDENVALSVPEGADAFPFPSAEEYYTKLWADQGFES